MIESLMECMCVAHSIFTCKFIRDVPSRDSVILQTQTSSSYFTVSHGRYTPWRVKMEDWVEKDGILNFE